jgi:hypothetical protein
MADDETQGTGHYPGPDHSFLSDVLDWSGAHELPGRAQPRPQLLTSHQTGEIIERARASRSVNPATQLEIVARPWTDTGSGPGR